MVKRNLILALWFFAGWTLGSFLAWFMNMPAVIGPLVGVAAVVVILTASSQAGLSRTSTPGA